MNTLKRQPYLIQRAEKKHNPNRNGLDSILEYDYMGSAEFEFGALSYSLKRIRSNKESYNLYNEALVFNNKKIFFQIYTKEPKEVVLDVIKKLANNSLRLKERSALPEYINKTQKYIICNFWWDIENDFMFWATEDGSFKKKFLEVI